MQKRKKPLKFKNLMQYARAVLTETQDDDAKGLEIEVTNIIHYIT